MSTGPFDLTTRAFNVLKADYVSNRSDIAELVEDAEFDEVFDPQEIQRAQQSLLAPNTRLEQEISWLPELSQAQTSNVLNLIASGDLEALIESSKHAPELAKANILAHFAGTGNVNDSLFHALVAAWDEIDQATLLSFINENRLSAGFPRVENRQMYNALKELEKLHARSAAEGIWTLDRPGEAMDWIVEAELRRQPSSSFLEQFVRNYDTLSEPDLARISDEIDKVISDAENTDADLEALVTQASDLLVRWDDVNQPVQVYEQHQGHEEGRSKRIYEKLRSLCLDLANNRNEFAEARRLSEALLRTFPELESVAEVLKGDVAQLETLDEQQKLHQEYKALIDACEAAKTKVPTPVSTVLKIFKDTVSRGADDPIAFNIVRDLALHINNDCNDPQTAFKLLDGVLTFSGARPSQELGKTLEEERAVLHRNWKMNELEKNSGNLTGMSETVGDLLKYASGSERAELQQLKAKLDRKRFGKKLKWGIYASIAAVIGFFVIADEMDRPSSRSTYQPSSPSVATPTPAPSASAEARPPVGQGLTFNRSQIRYCVFQGQRLETIRTLTNTNYQIDRFNELIADFNSRCSNYRYRSGALSSVQREAREKAAELRADARRIVSSW
ncbi:MAG: hypothetical protein ACRBB0_22980 [Pelagimonas sp.]|uniref:hypothetical protein n=1 Tax=Pelagimonas sp. TaxID=2073170 RepID=UPI003D6A8538